MTKSAHFFAELLERISQVLGQDVPVLGVVHVRRQGQRLGQEVSAPSTPGVRTLESQPKRNTSNERQLRGNMMQLSARTKRGSVNAPKPSNLVLFLT